MSLDIRTPTYRAAPMIPEHPDFITAELRGIHVGNLRRKDGGVVAYFDYAEADVMESCPDVDSALTYLRDRMRAAGHDVAEPVVITGPTIGHLDAETYHGDPVPEGSLSVSRAKVLLEEAGPARFRHREAHPETKPEWDLGTAAHALVLGKGAERLAVVEADSWRTKAAQAARGQARADGKTPLLPSQMRQAEDMAEALSRHPLAVETLTGAPEVAMFWQQDGLWLRGQMDVHAPGSHIGDYKTTADASARAVARDVWRYRYHMQAAWYQAGCHLLTGERLPFRLVLQEKTAPYLPSVWEPTEDYLELGRADMDDAIDLYLQCVESDQWPGYADQIQTLAPPPWATSALLEAEASATIAALEDYIEGLAS